MATASFDSLTIAKPYKNSFKNISQLVVSNMGANVLYVTVKGVKRPVPPANTDFGVPVPTVPFIIESYGNGFDIELKIDFDGGAGNAILDFLQLNCDQ